MGINQAMQAAHQYAMLFPAFARGEITATEIDAARVALEDAITSAISAGREANRGEASPGATGSAS